MFFKPSEFTVTAKLDRYYKLDGKIYSCLYHVEKDDPEFRYWQHQALKMLNEKKVLEDWFKKHNIDY